MLVARLDPRVSRDALATVRGIAGLEVALGGEPCMLWLRGELNDAADTQRFHALPYESVFEVCKGDSLIPLGKTLPVARLPEDDLGWRPLREWLVLKMPAGAMAGHLRENDLGGHSLVRISRDGQVPNLMVTTLAVVHDYVDGASEARLSGLRYAASGDGWVVLLGDPLLPIPGKNYHLSKGLALPLGWGMSLPLHGVSIKRCLGLAASEMAVIHEDGSFDRVREDDFLRLTRSSVRLTFERLQLQEVLEEEASEIS